jgi:hypothetical protein
MLNISSSKLDILLITGVIILLLGLLYNHRRTITISRKQPAALGVQELIEKVKEELIKTEEKRISAQQAPLFELKDFELEINYVITASEKESGGFEIKAVTLNSETETTTEKTQKIILRMSAIKPQIKEEKASPRPLDVNEDIIISQPPPPSKRGK